MKRSTRMLLMNSGRTGQRERGMGYRDYNPDPEYRFQDRRGREHYEDGRYAPMSVYDGGYGDMYRQYEPYIPPAYENRTGYRREDTHTPPGMHKIGFSVEGEMERMPQEPAQEYRHAANRQRMTDRTKDMYHAYGRELPFTKEIAMEWTGDMENSDGSKGPHWSMEQVRQVMEQRGIDCDPLQFFAVLNSVYSDYCAVAKKHGVNKMDFYADLAKAWLEDPDAVDDKASRYFEYIVKH